ncbi:ATP-binding cassette domain-containing protein [Kitasatospora aureofaciens]|uniref:ATP-binding cassette domain-containing protein n=1 Tax=Kitasatospora aureofaciens TaxID=1894 RepID=UPI003407D870
MDTAIRATGLGKRYGEHHALRGVDLEVAAGTVLGLLGPNGAGKTTTVRLLATLLEPDQGRAEVAGFDVVRQQRQVRRRIGLAGQYAAVDGLLTGRENLELLGRLLHLGRKGARARAAELLTRFELEGAAEKPAQTYSGGMRRRLDLAAALIGRPEVLFLDEPTTGLDPASRLVLWEMVREQVAQGVTVLLTTQYLEEADFLADRILVIDTGQVIAEGTPDELKRKVGEEWLEVGVSTDAALPQALAVLAPVAAAQPEVDRTGRRITVQLADGIGTIAAAAVALESAGVPVTDFALRRPSLDDVFFHLTGRGTQVGRAPEEGAQPLAQGPEGEAERDEKAEKTAQGEKAGRTENGEKAEREPVAAATARTGDEQ